MTARVRGIFPGSVSLPYPDLLDAKGLVGRSQGPRRMGRAWSRRPGAPHPLLCGGINAAGLALVLTEAGFEGMTIFDGSLNEWRADTALPMAKGE